MQSVSFSSPNSRTGRPVLLSYPFLISVLFVLLYDESPLLSIRPYARNTLSISGVFHDKKADMMNTPADLCVHQQAFFQIAGLSRQNPVNIKEKPKLLFGVSDSDQRPVPAASAIHSGS